MAKCAASTRCCTHWAADMSRAQCRQLLLPAPQAGRARPAWRGCRPGCQLKGLVRFALLNGIKRMYVFCAIARASGLLTRAMWAEALAERRYPAAVPWEDTCLWAQVLCAMGQLARAIEDPAILFHRPSRMGRSVLRVEQFLAAAMAWAGDVVFAAAGLHLNDAAHHGKIYNHVKIAEEKSRFCAMEAILDSAARGM